MKYNTDTVIKTFNIRRTKYKLGDMFHYLPAYGTKKDPLFLATDIATVLEYSKNKTTALIRLVDDEEKIKLMFTKNNVGKGGNRKPVWFITSKGLFQICMRSKKEVAFEFREAFMHIKWGIRV